VGHRGGTQTRGFQVTSEGLGLWGIFFLCLRGFFLGGTSEGKGREGAGFFVVPSVLWVKEGFGVVGDLFFVFAWIFFGGEHQKEKGGRGAGFFVVPSVLWVKEGFGRFSNFACIPPRLLRPKPHRLC